MTSKTEEKPKKPKDDVAISPFLLLSDTQWRYITAMVENPTFSKKDAASHIGLSVSTIYEWTKKTPYVDIALEHARANIHEAALERRKQAVLKAIAVKIALLDSEDEGVRSKAASEIIEWELGKAKNSTDVTTNGKDISITLVYPDSDN